MDNSTLRASWMLKGPCSSAYFSGDTGYAGHFQQIRECLGAPALALIKVGAYGDIWLDIHMNPEAAVHGHKDLGATTMLPVQWATFNLATTTGPSPWCVPWLLLGKACSWSPRRWGRSLSLGWRLRTGRGTCLHDDHGLT